MQKTLCLFVLPVLISFCLPVRASVYLVRNGQPGGSIYVSPSALPGEKEAARELQLHIRKISGAEIPAVSSLSKGCMIVLGTADSKEIPASMKARLEGRQEESFLMKTDQSRLYIIGRTQVGTLYGAYTYLEKFLNVRWFYPGEEHIESRKDIRLPIVDDLQEPAFKYRTVSQTGCVGKARASKIWAARNKLQCTSAFGVRALTDPEQKDFFAARIASYGNSLGGHLTFYLAVPPQKYMKTHPEYFALVNGKRLQNTGHHNTHHCLSNPDVQKLVADYICGLHEKFGNKITYLFGAPDSGKNWCECPACKALDEDGKFDVSRRYHTVAQKIAAMVYARHPDAQLELWAYANYRSIPKNVSIDPRMVIYFCSHGRCFAHRIDDPSCVRNVEMLELIRQWMKLNPRLHLYEYAHCTPMTWTPLERTLAADLKTFRKMGILGWKEEISLPDADWGKVPSFDSNPHHGAYRLRHEWLYFNVAGKLAWNPDLDVNAVIADIESKYYGRAYPAMKRFNDLRREVWDNSHGCMGYPTGDSRTPLLLMKEGLQDELLKLLKQADGLAGDDPVLKRRLDWDRKFLEYYWIRPNQSYRARQGKILAAPQAASPVVIDGSPDDPAWAGAYYLSDFKQAYTSSAKSLPSELKTSVGILSDEKNFYFLFICNEPSPQKLKAIADHNGPVWSDDSIEIFLDPHNIANTYYQAVVNTRGKIFSAAQPGSRNKGSLGVQAAARVEKDRYVIEVRMPADKMDCVFQRGALWNVHFARNRQINDGRISGCISVGGEQYHQRSGYRTLSIGKPLIQNGNFDDLDAAKGIPKGWTLTGGKVVSKGQKNNVSLGRSGQLSQLVWDWKGPLGQSPQKRAIKILVRASGKGGLSVFAPAYHDNWEGGKLRRKYFGNESIGLINLTPETKIHTLHYVIKPDQWIGLFFTALDQAVIEGITVLKE